VATVRHLASRPRLTLPGSVGATRVWATNDAGLHETTNNAEVLTNVVPPVSGNSNLVRPRLLQRR